MLLLFQIETRGPFTYRRNASGTFTFESAAFDGGRLTEAGPRYFVTDHLGSVRAVIDGTAASTTTYPPTGFYSIDDYAPYGTKSTSGASSYLSLAATGSTVSLRDSFTGQEDQGPDFGLPYIDYGARQYSPALSRWLVPDPMGEKYYDVSPYVYCAGNPVVLVDLDGQDWYSTKNANGEVEYHYDDNIKSSSDFNRLNISGRYLGKTYLASGKYYSLFGGIVQYKDNNGALTFEGQLVKSIDELIIKNYSAQNSCDNNAFNTENESEPSVDFFFNMPKGEYNFTYSGQFEQQPFHNVKKGSIYRSVDRANMRLKIQQMPPETPRRLGGYGLGYNEPKWYGCFMLIGNNRFNTIQVQFDQDNAALFRKALNKQFSR